MEKSGAKKIQRLWFILIPLVGIIFISTFVLNTGGEKSRKDGSQPADSSPIDVPESDPLEGLVDSTPANQTNSDATTSTNTSTANSNKNETDLTGAGKGGGGTGEGTIGLGTLGTIGHGAGTGVGHGYGSGSGSLSNKNSHRQSNQTEPPPKNFENYKVLLGVDSLVEFPSNSNELRVWIGSESSSEANSAKFAKEMKKDSSVIPALGESATVTPIGPAFKFNPEKTQCLKIHPSGSEIRFTFEPVESGEFEVGADIYLFDSPDCSGAAIPKTAANLKVVVKVNRVSLAKIKGLEMAGVFWEKLLSFWGVLLSLFFGLLLFTIRKFLKKKFGYQEKG